MLSLISISIFPSQVAHARNTLSSMASMSSRWPGYICHRCIDPDSRELAENAILPRLLRSQSTWNFESCHWCTAQLQQSEVIIF